MARETMNDLAAFLAVAREQSFTRAAASLNVSTSALSHAMRRLEEQVGIRLLNRTTRKVSPTEAGDRLVNKLRPALEMIEAELSSLRELRDRPSGMIRITTSKHAATTVLWPKLTTLLHDYPDVRVELSFDSGFSDLVSERFDAGVRLGEAIAKDMIAVKIGPDLRMAVVGAPTYFESRSIPQSPDELAEHQCINQRKISSASLYQWELEKDGREFRVRVDGQLVFDDDDAVLQAALDGFGLAFVMESYVTPAVANGSLVRVLDDWCQPFAGYHLYYPSRRQPSAAFKLVAEALKVGG